MNINSWKNWSFNSKYLRLSNEVIRYIIIGVITQLIDLLTYVILVEIGVQYVLADLLNNPLSLGFNYLGHKYFTFKNADKHRISGSKYVINLIVNYFYATGVLVIATELIADDPIIGKLIQILAIPLINFASLKLFVFAKKEL